MRFSSDFLAELRARVPLSALVGRAVTYDRRKSQPAKGDHWACCPFHQEKTPSFHVDDRKGYYHCFGCHASGDHLTFLTEHDGLSFTEAVEKLAAEAGVALPDAGAPEPPEVKKRREGRRALEAAAAFYTATLRGPAGGEARAYAAGRGLSRETLAAFAFGLAPGAATALLRHLEGEGFSAGTLEAAGLSVTRERGPTDRFRGRLMVPIHDARGAIVGFGGRTLEGRDPKYLNSPQSLLFDKSAVLFNAHRAKGPAHRAGRLVVVEGYMDAIALAEAGIGETVASLGTALTDAQIAGAWQLADEPVLCFDGDRAGLAAASRAFDRIVPALTVGRSFGFVAMPAGEDPDDVVRRDGKDAFEALIGGATPLVDALFQREVDRGVGTPERMAALETRLEALAASIKDERVGRLYREAFRERTFQLRRTTRAARPPEPKPRTGDVRLRAPASADQSLLDVERILLGLLVFRPSLMEGLGERLSATPFANEAHGAFAAMLLEAYGDTLAEDAAPLMAALPARARLVLGEVYGDDASGGRLRQRFAILEHAPDERFLARCAALFVDRLVLRAHMAELSAGPGRLADGDMDEARLLSLTSAIHERRREIAEEERTLADEAAALRRRRDAPSSGKTGA